jgi:putative hemolysin
MIPLDKGKYTVTRAETAADLSAAFSLRGLCFGVAGGASDRFDDTSEHVLVRAKSNGAPVATFRTAVYVGAGVANSYAAQYYDIERLYAFEGPMLELGRFCIHPAHRDPDIARIAWASLTAFVDKTGVQMLFGCSSFAGTCAAPYLDAFALLRARHLGPARWQPAIKAGEVFRYGEDVRTKPDLARANGAMPPLLRTYLMMGGWVSDHAVVDREMNTLHVFTALETGAIPATRKKLLRALV